MTPTVLPDAAAVAHAAAAWLIAALSRPGTLAVALSGGSTPKRLYELLAQPPYRSQIPWDRTHWFLGDERFVPPDDEQSNIRMIRQAMLDEVAVPGAHIHPIPTVGFSPEAAAADYARELQAHHDASDEPILFDAVLMGLGPDGHTASLFPGSPALDERAEWATAVTRPGGLRGVTLTYPALEFCRHAAFLVAGADKRDALHRVLAGEDLPAARYKPHGTLTWFVDAAATPPMNTP